MKAVATVRTPGWAERVDAIPCDQLYLPVSDLFPAPPAAVLDIGAGTGRDAAWLRLAGYKVTAVDPSPAMRDTAMRLHPALPACIDDALPALATLTGAYDLILLSGVWHLLNEKERQQSLPRLAHLTADGGLVVISLRHGATGVPIDVKTTIRQAEEAGFRLERRATAVSTRQAASGEAVQWTWLALRH